MAEGSAARDRELLDRITRARDETAFGQLYDAHTPALYRLAMRLSGGDRDASEDIVHDAWIAAVPRMGSFAGRSRLSTWLGGFIVNIARQRLRDASRMSPMDDALTADDGELLGVYDRTDLERALASLPHGFREAIVLHDVEGYTHEEIAALLGVTAGTSKSQLSRARAAIRRMLRRERATDREDHD